MASYQTLSLIYFTHFFVVEKPTKILKNLEGKKSLSSSPFFKGNHVEFELEKLDIGIKGP